MTREVRIIDVFVSNPRDVNHEREQIKSIAHEWNVLRSKATACHINILTWEDGVAPALSDRPQSVINAAIGDEYDVYLGMMWGRFGSPTGVAESGTVEEFDRALDRYRHGDSLRLAMLFKMAPIPPADLSGEEFDKVKAFKKRFSDEGGLYREFEDDETLRKIVNHLFEDIAAAHAPRGGGGSTNPKGHPAPDRANSQFEAPSNGNFATDIEGANRPGQYADIGLFELNDKLAEVAGAQTTFLERLSEVNQRTTKIIDEANAEMQRLVSFGSATPATLRKPIAAIIGGMNDTALYLETNLPDFRSRDDELLELTELGFDLASDFKGDHDNEEEFRAAVEEVVSTLAFNRDSLDSLIETVQGLPRMTTDFNHSKKRLASIQTELRTEIDRLVRNLEATLSKYRENKLLAV